MFLGGWEVLDDGGFANEQEEVQDKELEQRNVRPRSLIDKHENRLFCHDTSLTKTVIVRYQRLLTVTEQQHRNLREVQK